MFYSEFCPFHLDAMRKYLEFEQDGVLKPQNTPVWGALSTFACDAGLLKKTKKL